MGSAKATSRTYETYKLIYETLMESPDTFIRQADLAKLLNLSTATVSRTINHPAFGESFKTGKLGGLQVAGPLVTMTQFDRDETVKMSLSEARALFVRLYGTPSRKVVTEGFKQGSPSERLAQGIAWAKYEAEHGSNPNKGQLTGKDLMQIFDDLEEFAVGILALVDETKAQPRYGKKDWALDYV